MRAAVVQYRAEGGRAAKVARAGRRQMELVLPDRELGDVGKEEAMGEHRRLRRKEAAVRKDLARLESMVSASARLPC